MPADIRSRCNPCCAGVRICPHRRSGGPHAPAPEQAELWRSEALCRLARPLPGCSRASGSHQRTSSCRPGTSRSLGAVPAGRRHGRAHALPGALYTSNLSADSPVAGNSHGLGMSDAIRLATVLNCAPRRLVVLAVEAADTSVGYGLSRPVMAAIPMLAAAVLHEVGASALGLIATCGPVCPV